MKGLPRANYLETMQADVSKLSVDQQRERLDRLERWQRKDLHQIMLDDAAGLSEHEGFIYILSNPAMPGLVKIGFTTGRVADRVADIGAATGVPAQFKIEWKL